MKKIIACMLILVLSFTLIGCESGAIVDGTFVKSYGLMSKEDKVAGVEYEISMLNTVWAIVAFETVIVPIIYLAEYMYVPVTTVVP